MIARLDLKGGNIIYDDFHINLDGPFENQIWEIKEDLLQIRYGDYITVDVGFYPEFDISGSFCIKVIKNYNWEEPLMQKEAGSKDLLIVLQECINFAADLQKQDS